MFAWISQDAGMFLLKFVVGEILRVYSITLLKCKMLNFNEGIKELHKSA